MTVHAPVATRASLVTGAPAKPSHVLVATDHTGAESAVLDVAQELARRLHIPLRLCHISKVTAAVEQTSALAVVGAPQPHHLEHGRTSGAAFVIAHRVSSPALFVPHSVRAWGGPRRVLVPLDGAIETAVGSSMALIGLSSPETVATTMHVFDENTMPVFWDNPFYDTQSWSSEFRARFVDRFFNNGFALGTGLAGPVEQILEVAANEDVDMIVIVWSQRRLQDSPHGVAVELLVQSPVPVLLVPSSFAIEKLTELSGVTETLEHQGP
jgi:hypothetical protein